MFHGKIIFQLLSCLYLYDSGIRVRVCIRKPSRSTDYRPVVFIYRAVGQQTPGTGADIPCRRSTDSWHRREVCAKSVDRLLASKGLNTTDDSLFRPERLRVKVTKDNIINRSITTVKEKRSLQQKIHTSSINYRTDLSLQTYCLHNVNPAFYSRWINS